MEHLADWASMQAWMKSHEYLLGWVGGLSLISFMGTLIAVPLLIVALPPRYLVNNGNDNFLRKTIWRVPYLLVKNAIGAFLVLAGIAMLVLPGQGLLTLLIGATLINFPGKRTLVRKLLRRKKVAGAVNRLREMFHRPPLEMPGD